MASCQENESSKENDSSNESLEKVGDVFLIHYKPGPSPSALPDWEKVKNGSADEPLKTSVRQQQQWKTVALIDGKLLPVMRPAMWTDSNRVIGEELWWMKPLSKDKEDEDFTVYKGVLQPKRHYPDKCVNFKLCFMVRFEST